MMRRRGWAVCLPLLVRVLVLHHAPELLVIEQPLGFAEETAPRAPFDEEYALPVGRPFGL